VHEADPNSHDGTKVAIDATLVGDYHWLGKEYVWSAGIGFRTPGE
jgi:hypothetical protein